jgi:hypothetical protein
VRTSLPQAALDESCASLGRSHRAAQHNGIAQKMET